MPVLLFVLGVVVLVLSIRVCFPHDKPPREDKFLRGLNRDNRKRGASVLTDAQEDKRRC